MLFNTRAGDVAAGEWGLAALPGREAGCARRYRSRAGLRHRPRLPLVHLMAGVVPAGADRQRYLDTFIANALCRRRLRPTVSKVLIKRSAHRSSPTTCSPVNIRRPAVAAIERPNVFIQFDFFRAKLVDGNISGLLETLAGRYAHIRIASVPDRHGGPDDGRELNYPWLFDRLDALGYQGWVGCEYRPRGRLPPPGSAAETLPLTPPADTRKSIL
ncbi:TIM barrel protein [Serratia ureilytica]